MGRIIKAKLYGFTLVELLIVVAIIGILATVGVPTFRKMTQKAKKSEAKVLLGGVFTAESAFQAEYGMYGNYLDKIGFEAGGGPNIYVVGFPTTTCDTNLAIAPDSGNSVGSNLNTQYPSYYSDTTGFKSAIKFTGGPTGGCTAGVVDASGLTFVANAHGVISPTLSKASANSADFDIWTINQTKTLINIQDGVK